MYVNKHTLFIHIHIHIDITSKKRRTKKNLAYLEQDTSDDNDEMGSDSESEDDIYEQMAALKKILPNKSDKFLINMIKYDNVCFGYTPIYLYIYIYAHTIHIHIYLYTYISIHLYVCTYNTHIYMYK